MANHRFCVQDDFVYILRVLVVVTNNNDKVPPYRCAVGCSEYPSGRYQRASTEVSLACRMPETDLPRPLTFTRDLAIDNFGVYAPAMLKGCVVGALETTAAYS